MKNQLNLFIASDASSIALACEQDENDALGTVAGTLSVDASSIAHAYADDDESEFDGFDDDDQGEDVECDCGEIVSRDDPHYSSYCGTFCVPCMKQHRKACGICRADA